MPPDTTYALITPARNEEAYISGTIDSVVSQSVLPLRWVIVSDGSTDRTDEIVADYAAKYDFIELLRREPDTTRNFGSKVFAVRAGLERLAGIEYDVLGNLDADVTFEPDYYERVLDCYQNDPELGVAGGVLLEADGQWTTQISSLDYSVAGPVQMFRRACWEAIGGYVPLPKGGVDAIAETMARMHGWKVRAFPDLHVKHLRRTGTEKGHILFARFRQGIMEHSHGYHPLFQAARCLGRTREKPYVIGSAFRLSGYVWAALKRQQHAVPPEVVKFLRCEQMGRLRGARRRKGSERP